MNKQFRDEILKTLNRRRIIPAKKNDCYGWIGIAKDKRNVIHRIWVSGKTLSPHRAAWTAANGPIPVNTYVLHSCKNALCTNPAHLYLSNTRTMNTTRKSSRNGRKRLSVDLPTKLMENLREAASKHNQTITKYVFQRLHEAIRYEQEIDRKPVK